MPRFGILAHEAVDPSSHSLVQSHPRRAQQGSQYKCSQYNLTSMTRSRSPSSYSYARLTTTRPLQTPPLRSSLTTRLWRTALLIFASLLSSQARAVIARGIVTNTVGVPVIHANVVLLQKGQIVALALTQLDGSYQITSSASGRFYVLVSANNFKQITTLGFYAGAVDSHEENIVLETTNAHQEIVTTATGLPTPDAQTSVAVSVSRSNSFLNRVDLLDVFRQTPGAFVVRQGQYGGVASLYLRGGPADTNDIILDGVPIADVGGGFDYSNLASAGVAQVEIYRGPNSVLFGSGAASGSVSLDSPRGSTGFPSFFYEGDAGTFTTFRNQAMLGGTHNKLDYYGGFEARQSSNAVPLDSYHDDTATAQLGYAFTGATSLRATARNSDAAAGTPGPFRFYGIANAGKRADQDLSLGVSLEHRAYSGWHNLLRYGLARRREQDITFYPAGIQFTDSRNYYGHTTTIVGANRYAVAGQAVLNFPGTYPNTIERVSNRDQLYVQSDYPFTERILGLFTFRYMDERGAKKSTALAINQTLERANYAYTAQVQGSFRKRLLYSLGGGVEKNGLFGTVGTPRLGLAYYPVLPGDGILHGTRVAVNFSNGYREPSLDEQFASLYDFLQGEPEGTAAVTQLRITPLAEEQSRTYEGAVTQSFLSERGQLRVGYFHSEYGRLLEPVPSTEAPLLLPQLTAAQRLSLTSLLNQAGDLAVNSGAFRAMGLESEAEYALFPDLRLRAGYTYLDAVVRRSFTSDALAPSFNLGLPDGPQPGFAAVPIGGSTPLRGARPFQRPPHTAYAGAAYQRTYLALNFTASYASRSDDSTFLAGRDVAGGDSLLLPNRNLDFQYTKLDLAGSVQLSSFLNAYAQLDNLTSNKKIGPIGYPSLPFTYRLGLRLALGHQKK